MRFLFDCELEEKRFLYDSMMLQMGKDDDGWYLKTVEVNGDGAKLLRLFGETEEGLRIWHASTFGYLLPSEDTEATYGLFRKLPRLDGPGKS